ncbi:MAG TPA: hypothetical protein VFP96_09125 [Candidatus Acidoferrum sp.]|nr:hypothetical protein [Candidatus Acidoferrum sp.]
MIRRVVVFFLVSALAAGEFPAHAAVVAVVGVVTQASRANLASANVSAGANVYDGDSLTTASDGLLCVRTGAAQFYLAAHSGVRLHSAPTGTLVQLTAGTLVFSSAKSDAMEVEISQARIRAAVDIATVAQISSVSPRIIEVRAKRGALQLSYKDDTELIPEGSSARILLDPTDEETASASAPSLPPFPDQKGPRAGKKRRKAFFIFWGGVAALTIGWLICTTVESPSKP